MRVGFYDPHRTNRQFLKPNWTDDEATNLAQQFIVKTTEYWRACQSKAPIPTVGTGAHSTIIVQSRNLH
jgi:hypothetical protein